jgi:CheY-like chemotaxis protein
MDTAGIEEKHEALCNPTELTEVFINIMNNALDAMPDGGRIAFSVKSDKSNIFISVSDTGIGMSEEVKKKIFDPFFTTRLPQGTGLGMSIVYSIIKRHGGKIDVESEIGKGATFNISIPIRNEMAQKVVSPSKPIRDKITKKLRILVVDDEKDICEILERFLTTDGHIVKTVNNGAEAIDLARKEQFDLVLSDLVMPDNTGYDVVMALNKLERRPKIGIITGWSEDLTSLEKENLKVDFIIKKPLHLSEIARHINEAFCD